MTIVALNKALQLLTNIQDNSANAQEKQENMIQFLSFLLSNDAIKVFLTQEDAIRKLIIDLCQKYISEPDVCSNVLWLALQTRDFCEETEMEDLFHEEALKNEE
jgi:hypothetical protein